MNEDDHSNNFQAPPGLSPAANDLANSSRTNMSAIDPEELGMLQELVHNARGFKDQAATGAPEPLPLPEPAPIDPVKAQQIKSMREATAHQTEETPPFFETFRAQLIQIWCNVSALFAGNKGSRHCVLNGHECKHCGRLFPSDVPPPGARQ